MKKESPLVTVYITNYNYQKYISEAINSVLSQSYENIEILIIDDGSTDSSKKVIEDYREIDNIKIIYQHNKGLTKTNNNALRLASGKYIVRLDADDRLHKNAITLLVNGFTDDKIAMVFGNWNVVDEKGDFLYTYQRHDFNKEVTLLDMPAHGACTMFQTKLIKDIGGYDENLKCQDGYDLWFRVIEKYEVKSLDDVLFDYRRHGSNLTGNEERILSTRAKILDKVSKKKDSFNKKAFAFLPVRGSKIDARSMPFQKILSKYLIDYIIESLIKSSVFESIVVSTPDDVLMEYLNDKYKGEVIIHSRSADTAKINTSLDEVLVSYLNGEGSYLSNYDYGVLIGTDRPFNRDYIIKSAINIANIFDVDNVIGVRSTSDMFFKHTGGTLKSINFSSESLRLERDELYKMVRGFNVFKVSNLLDNKKLWGDIIGHVVFDQISAHAIDSFLDIKVAELYLNEI